MRPASVGSVLGAMSLAVLLGAVLPALSRAVRAADMPALGARVANASALPASNAVVAQSRSFGYVVGDIVAQRVLLELEGRAVTPRELPQSGPLGLWLERRSTRIETDGRGRKWLAVDYQIMNSPQALTMVTVPAWTINPQEQGAPIRVGEWTISVAPLTPEKAFAKSGFGGLRPDRAAMPIDVAPMRHGMSIWIAAFVTTLAAWGAWLAWRNWLASQKQPFAAALREMRGIDESAPEVWHALHRAFDQTAGRVVQAGALMPLFQRAPYLEPKRPDIERFFAESAARFFGIPGSAGQPVSLRALAGELRQIEKRHER